MAALDHKFSRLAALKPVRPPAVRSTTLREPCEEDTMARVLGAGVSTNHFGEHLAVRNWFSTPEFVAPHLTCLQLLCQQRDAVISRRARAALENPEKWLFLDTETTGLAGGTGTYAFLIGLAWWDAGGLQVEQLFMRDFAEEHSVLCQLAARLAERPVLVTFNGKTFDWPLLENRFRMTRSIAAPSLAAHLDLLHPARALWKFRLGTVRLIDLEREVLNPMLLGWCRQGDVSSRFIPQFYFDYLRGGPPEPLLGVARHNQMDLRGLVALFGKINALLAEETNPDEAMHGLDLFGLSKFLNRRGHKGRAQVACAQAVDLGLPVEFHSRAQYDLALMAKRRGEHQRAAELWHKILAHSGDAIQACEQLAIHYEKRVKDYERALEFAHRARKLLRTQANQASVFARGGFARREDVSLKRIKRLEVRLTKRSGRLLELANANAGGSV
ncbi:MAG TPA: ribonuclease H-like domain-containing protein [Candidatus Acidoferrales bacterium]|nr:ribonuclease H-like domain-containing protein [Candidatus Acidoferrales bacterium]